MLRAKTQKICLKVLGGKNPFETGKTTALGFSRLFFAMAERKNTQEIVKTPILFLARKNELETRNHIAPMSNYRVKINAVRLSPQRVFGDKIQAQKWESVSDRKIGFCSQFLKTFPPSPS